MEDFTYFDFDSKGLAGRTIDDNHFRGYLHSTSAITMNKKDSALIHEKGMTHLRVQRNNLTGEIFLVFNKGKGIELKKYRGNCGITITNKELVKFLFKNFGITNTEPIYNFCISPNLAKIEEIVTFKVIKVEEK